jgi:hypothetical protein
MSNEPDDLITSAEAAVILHKSSRTVHRMVADKRLIPVQRIHAGYHGTFLFHRADIETLAREDQPA